MRITPEKRDDTVQKSASGECAEPFREQSTPTISNTGDAAPFLPCEDLISADSKDLSPQIDLGGFGPLQSASQSIVESASPSGSRVLCDSGNQLALLGNSDNPSPRRDSLSSSILTSRAAGTRRRPSQQKRIASPHFRIINYSYATTKDCYGHIREACAFGSTMDYPRNVSIRRLQKKGQNGKLRPAVFCVHGENVLNEGFLLPLRRVLWRYGAIVKRHPHTLLKPIRPCPSPR